ncbi:MAG: GGDEF domain-containing protein [Spirochaetes bacterium]|nr:GGDEF domain-containing protein [Spirochaetota bacterium]
MRDFSEKNEKKGLLDSPQIAANKDFLQSIGVFDLIDRLCNEIGSFESLLFRGLNIFDCTTIDEIMDTAVFQINDLFNPSFISFLWKPIQNREDVTIKSYQNAEAVNLNIKISGISRFEALFDGSPDPVNFDLWAEQHKDAALAQALAEAAPNVVIPILGPFGLYGIILVSKKNNNEDYTEKELEYLKQLVRFISHAIKNHLHYQQSLHDVKTGLYNHGFFMTRLKEELARIRLYNYSSSLLVLDVDNFKNFNDNYGHLAGDRALECLALMFKDSLRKNDILSRFGGEEFTILFPQTNEQTAWYIAERLRTNALQMKIPWDVPLPSVSVSIGIFSFSEVEAVLGINEIINRADEALFISKRNGKNCSTVWNRELQDKVSAIVESDMKNGGTQPPLSPRFVEAEEK